MLRLPTVSRFQILISVLLILAAPALHAMTAIASGNWTTPSNWTPSGPPTGTDSVVIPGGFNITLDSNGSCQSLVIGQGGSGTATFQFAASTTLNVGGTVTLGNGGVQGTLDMSAVNSLLVCTGLVDTNTNNFVPGNSLNGGIQFTADTTLPAGAKFATFNGIFTSSIITVTLAQPITINNQLNLTQGILDFANFNVTAGGIIGGGGIQMGSGNLTVGAAGFNFNFSGNIQGSGGITKVGSSIYTAAGIHGYTGATKILAGIVDIPINVSSGSASPLGNATSAVLLGDTSGSAAATIQIHDSNTFDRDISVQSGSIGPLRIFRVGAPGTATVTGVVTLNQTLQIDGGSGLNFSGQISGTGGVAVIGGSVTYSGSVANTYSGITQVNGSSMLSLSKSASTDAIAGPLNIGDASANTDSVHLQSDEQINDSVTVTINASGYFGVNDHVEAISLATSAGNIDFGSGGTSVLTLKQPANATFSGNTSGSAGFPTSVIKQGTGILVVTGNISSLGGIQIDAGTLEIDGNAAAVVININGGELSGNGTVGNVASIGGGSVSPGAPGTSTGIIHFDDMGFDSSTTLNITINGPNAGADFDQIIANPADTFEVNNAALNLTVTSSPNINDSFEIIQNSNGLYTSTNLFGNTPGNKINANGMTFQISKTAGTNSKSVVLTRVPMDTVVNLNTPVNPIDENVNISFTASVSPVAGGPTPTGTIQFKVGGATLGSPVTLDASGNATSITTFFTSSGDIQIDAIYSGDADYNSSSDFLFEHTGHISSPLSAIAIPGQSFLYTVQHDVSSAKAVSISGLPPSGHLFQNPMVTTEIIGTPDATDIGSYTVHLSVIGYGQATADVSLIVDTQPIANAQGPLTTAQDTPLNITLSGSDADSQTLTFSMATPPAHGTISGSAPDITYSPTPGYSGTDSFTYIANDGLLDSAPATVSLNIIRVAPTITSASSATGAEEQFFSFDITFTGSAPVTLDIANLPGGLTFDGTTISGTPASAGTTHVTVTASNGVSPDATQDLVITISPGPLRITSPDSATGKVGAGFSYEITASGTPPFTFNAANLPDGLTFDRSTISGTPKSEGTLTVNLTANGGNNESASLDLTITVQSKNDNLPPNITMLAVEPSPGVVNDDVFFLAVANDPENADLTFDWDFGDGTGSSGALVSHSFATAGTYSVVVSVSDGVNTSTKSSNLIIENIDPNAPRITDVVPSINPAHAGDTVTIDATVTDPNGAAVTLTWNFGDGTPFAHGTSVTHSFAANGEYVVTVTAKNANGFNARPFNLLFFVVDPGGVNNVNEGTAPTENPLNGLSIALGESSNGVTQLDINVDALNRAAFDVETNFGIPGRFKVRGTHPVAKFEKASIYVATTVAKDVDTREVKGKARKTIPISAKEVGAPVEFTADPPSRKIQVDSLKGNFLFGRTGAATGPKSIPDQVTLGGRITLPAGLKLDHDQEVHIAVGNVVDRIVLSPKGKGQGKFSKLGLKGGKAAADGTKEGKFKVSMRLAGMTNQGFDTEGVDPHPKKNDLNIQCAILVGGETYAIDTPVTLKVTPKGDKGLISGRGGP